MNEAVTGLNITGEEGLGNGARLHLILGLSALTHCNWFSVRQTVYTDLFSSLLFWSGTSDSPLFLFSIRRKSAGAACSALHLILPPESEIRRLGHYVSQSLGC